MSLENGYLENYDALYSQGMKAAAEGDSNLAACLLGDAAFLAQTHTDHRRASLSLVPKAKAEWSIGDFDTAEQTLSQATEAVSGVPGLADEVASVETAKGRARAVKAVALYATDLTVEKRQLAVTSVPHFQNSRRILSGNDHYYYRYANASHGSVVAAMAGKRVEAGRLLLEGIVAAFRRPAKSTEYDKVRAYKINSKQLVQLGAAALLVPMANKTPVLASLARSRLVR